MQNCTPIVVTLFIVVRRRRRVSLLPLYEPILFPLAHKKVTEKKLSDNVITLSVNLKHKKSDKDYSNADLAGKCRFSMVCNF